MPIGQNSLELNSFYNLPEKLTGKSIQPSWRFYVLHLYNPLGGIESIRDAANTLLSGPPPLVRSYHVVEVGIPTYQFEKESVKYGVVPRTFPVLSLDRGLDLEITYEEDELGTVAYLINWLQKQIIDEKGLYKGPLKNRMMVMVEVQDKNGIPVAVYIFHDCYYHLSGEPRYSYAFNDSIKYNISYGFDRMSVSFPKYSLVGAVVNTAKGISEGVKALRARR